MNTLARSVLTLYAYDEKANDTSRANVLRQCIELIALFPQLAVYGYQAYCYDADRLHHSFFIPVSYTPLDVYKRQAPDRQIYHGALRSRGVHDGVAAWRDGRRQ